MSAVATTVLSKWNVKVTATSKVALDYRAFIPVFHRLIQEQKLGGLLVDVAEYTHIPQGPQVLLVAHEGQWVLDSTGGTPGLLYSQRHPAADGAATTEAALARALRELYAGCAVLEAEPEGIAAGLGFQCGKLDLVANDRGAAPNSPATYAVLEPAVKSVLGKLFPGATPSIKRDEDPRRRSGFTVDGGALSLADARKRLT